MNLSTQKDIQHLRQEYRSASLSENDIHVNPMVQFQQWFNEALQGGVKEPNAMTLATADLKGKPSARTLLLKGFDERGFSFFTNYESRKGRELAENSFATMLFFWLDLERQVTIEGAIERLSYEESVAYFHERPRESQIGAWVSRQDVRLDSRAILEQQLLHFTQKFDHESIIPMPDYWGGYLLKPQRFEFWQGRPARLHDRIVFEQMALGKDWTISRLSP